MTTIDATRLLIDMRALAAQAAGGAAGVPAAGAGPAGTGTVADFGVAMKEALARVNELQQGAATAAAAFERGAPGVDLTSVMLEVQKAQLAFKAVTEVRNRLVAAYQEVMSMPI
jgi:flagellar hook-basal body complex protein FliE